MPRLVRFEQLAMEATRCRYTAPVLPMSCVTLQRSYSSSSNLPSAAAPSLQRSLSPNRYGSASSINFALERSVSLNRNLQARSSVRPGPSAAANHKKAVPARKACMCSPSNHPGSFRCSLHRKSPPVSRSSSSTASTNSQLHMRRSAMTNSLVRIGSVEGEWVKRALTALIRPSNRQMRRRTSFQPRPSRLRHMTRAEDVALS